MWLLPVHAHQKDTKNICFHEEEGHANLSINVKLVIFSLSRLTDRFDVSTSVLWMESIKAEGKPPSRTINGFVERTVSHTSRTPRPPFVCVLIWAWNSQWWKKCSAPTVPEQPAVIFILIFLPWLLFPPAKGPAPWKNAAFPSRLKYSPNPPLHHRKQDRSWNVALWTESPKSYIYTRTAVWL